MKKKILLLMGIFTIGLANAQVGINTTNPQGVFHLDAKGDTNGSTNTNDDVIVTKEGNIGIGTIAPQAKVDIYANYHYPIRINSGYGDPNKTSALFSDANGVAYWNPRPNLHVDGYTEGGGGSLTGASVPLKFTKSLQDGKPISGGATNTLQFNTSGNYRISLTGYANTDRIANAYYIVWIDVLVNNISVWRPALVGHTDIGQQPFSFSTIIYLAKGDQLAVVNKGGINHIANYITDASILIELMIF